MKKHNDNSFWFEIIEGVKPDGIGFDRYNRIVCRKCGKQAKHLNHGQSNEQMRKLFMRWHWKVGRAPNLHFCPECATNNKKHERREVMQDGRRAGHNDLPAPSEVRANVVPFIPPAPARTTLQQAWDAADDTERNEFWHYLQRVCFEHGVQLIYKDIPFDAQIETEIHQSDAADDIPTTDDDDEGAADWWKEINNKK